MQKVGLSKKKILLLILCVIIIVVGLYVAFNYYQGSQEFSGNVNILILCSDTSEKRPGVGSVDMAFVANVKDGNIVNLTPVYPGGMSHPTKQPNAELRSYGADKLYLHDALWSANVTEGTQIAQEIVESNTGLSSDMVVIVTPTAIDAYLSAVGSVNVNGTQVSGNSIDYLRDVQDSQGESRGDAIEGLMNGLKSAAQEPGNIPKLMSVTTDQMAQGNIIAVPEGSLAKFLSYQSIQRIIT